MERLLLLSYLYKQISNLLVMQMLTKDEETIKRFRAPLSKDFFKKLCKFNSTKQQIQLKYSLNLMYIVNTNVSLFVTPPCVNYITDFNENLYT